MFRKENLIILSIIAIVAIVGIISINNSNNYKTSINNLGAQAYANNLKFDEHITGDSVILTFNDDLNMNNLREMEDFYKNSIKEVEKYIDGKEISDCDGNKLSKENKELLIDNLKTDEEMNKFYFTIYRSAIEDMMNKYDLTLEEAQTQFSINEEILGEYDLGYRFPPIWYGCTTCVGSGHYCVGIACLGGNVKFGGCLIEGTKVTMHNTQKNIENLKFGDEILTFNFNTNKIEKDIITNIESNAPKDYYLINDKLKITKDHEIYISNKGWIKVSDLELNDELLSEEKNVKVISIEKIENNEFRIFDITTKKNHNFFANNILVHNEMPTMPTFQSVDFKITIPLWF